MVRKITALLFCAVILFAIGEGSRANAYSVYDGNMSNTYVTYFKDIVSGIGFNDHYVAFRSGQYEYTMVCGDLTYDGNQFILNSPGQVYTFTTDSSYGSYYRYNVSSIENFSLVTNDSIIYSDIGQYPQLVSRGEKYEMLSAVLMCTFMLGFVVFNLLRSR